MGRGGDGYGSAARVVDGEGLLFRLRGMGLFLVVIGMGKRRVS
jgi:hypothetical protein